MGLDATVFDGTVMVTTEISEASKFASVTGVMEITFAPRGATGILWPIIFVIKLAAVVIEQQKLNSNSRVMTIMVKMKRRLLTIGRLKLHGNRNSDKCSKINHIFFQNIDVSTSFFESSPQFL